MRIEHMALVIGACAALLMPSAAFAAGTKGIDLSLDCRSTVKAMEDTANATDDDAFKAMKCVRFIEGFEEGFNYRRVQGFAKFDPEFSFCDEGVTAYQISKILIKFTDENPKFLNEDAANVLWVVLMKNFPCDPTKPPPPGM
jgi:hypothetical protein